MRKQLAFTAFLTALIAGAGPAQACRFVRPAPPVIIFPYQALALGTVVRLAPDPLGGTIRIDRIIDGHSPARRLRRDRVVFVQPCTPTYEMRLRDRVFLVIRQGPHGPEVFSWLPFDIAKAREPFLTDYVNARDETERRAVVARWREQHRAELLIR